MSNLVLTGHLGERIIVGDDVVITVVRLDKGKVRLAFQAPESVSIDRECVRVAKIEGRAVKP